MADENDQQESAMEDTLASIRRILSEDEEAEAAAEAAEGEPEEESDMAAAMEEEPKSEPEPEPEPTPEEELDMAAHHGLELQRQAQFGQPDRGLIGLEHRARQLHVQ